MFGRTQFTFLGVLSLTSFGVSLPYTSQFQSKEGTENAEVCPPEFTGLLPHPVNCSLFYHCNDGTSNLKSCPSNLYFNPATSSCDWSWNVPCGEGTNPPTESTTSTTERPAPPDTEICRPGFFGYQNFPGSCNYYIICADGTAILRKCESGSSFDSKYATCKDSNLVEDCGGVDPIITTQVPTTPSTTPLIPTTSTPRATTTEESITEKTTTRTTTRPTTTTQRTTTRAPTQPTTTTTQRTTTTAPPGQFPCPSAEFIYMPHPNDCNKFYLCRNGSLISIYNCGVNLWFHAENQVCRVPWGSSCK